MWYVNNDKFYNKIFKVNKFCEKQKKKYEILIIFVVKFENKKIKLFNKKIKSQILII